MKLTALIKELQELVALHGDAEVVVSASKQEYDPGDRPHPGFYTTRSITNSKLTSIEMEVNMKTSSSGGASKTSIVRLHGTDGN